MAYRTVQIRVEDYERLIRISTRCCKHCKMAGEHNEETRKVICRLDGVIESMDSWCKFLDIESGIVEKFQGDPK